MFALIFVLAPIDCLFTFNFRSSLFLTVKMNISEFYTFFKFQEGERDGGKERGSKRDVSIERI